MAKKKSNRKKAKPSQNQSPRPSESFMRDLSQLLNEQNFQSPEEVNQFLQQQMSSGQAVLPARQAKSDLDRAQDTIYAAYEAKNKTGMIALARKALEISADCADAYLILAEHNAKVLPEALALYEAAVKAGERALGDEFKELKGHFWGYIETRPYMRARQGLAVTLWEMGRLQEAASHMQDMLELNPNDNQGIRDLYITLLLEQDDLTRLEKLLKQYPGDWSAFRKYGEALYQFKKTGRGDKADDLLFDAIAYNPYVPPYLIGKKRIPKNPSAEYYSPGDEREALYYVRDGIRPWSNTEGAMKWLGDLLRETETGSS